MCDKSNECTSTAVALALYASIIWSIGNNLMKKGHNDVNSDDNPDSSPFFKNKIWCLGFFVYFIGSIIGGKALSYGSLSVVGTLESLTLVFSAILARTFLNEKIMRKDIEGMVLIFIGCGLVVYLGPQQPKIDDTDDPDSITSRFKDSYFQTSFIVFMSIYTLVLLIFLFVMRYYQNLSLNKESMKTQKTVIVGRNVLLITYLILASYFYSWNLIIQKSFFTMINVKDWYKKVFNDWFFYYGIVGTVFANFGLEFFKQRAMKYYGVVTVIPIYRVGGVLTACMVAAIYFNEEIESINNQIGFGIAIVLTIVGIVFLTSYHQNGPCHGLKKAQQQVRESVCDSISNSL